MRDEHTVAVVRGNLLRRCPGEEWRAFAVLHIVGAARGMGDVGGQGKRGVAEAGRGGVDDEVVGRERGEVGETVGGKRHGGQRLLAGDDGLGVGERAVGKMQRRRLRLAQRQDDAARRTARAKDEDARAGEGDTVFLQGEAEAAAVGVVAAEFAVFLPEGIDRFCRRGVRRGAVAEAVGGLFVGDGNVQPAPAIGKEAGDDGGKVRLVFSEDAVVLQRNAARGGKSGVDFWRA